MLQVRDALQDRAIISNAQQQDETCSQFVHDKDYLLIICNNKTKLLFFKMKHKNYYCQFVYNKITYFHFVHKKNLLLPVYSQEKPITSNLFTRQNYYFQYVTTKLTFKKVITRQSYYYYIVMTKITFI
jgi:hypothetical protein